MGSKGFPLLPINTLRSYLKGRWTHGKASTEEGIHKN